MCLSPLRTRADYDHAFEVVRQVIYAWDPYNLVAGGAPADEWDGEIALLVAELQRIRSNDDAVAAVSRVFSAAFQPDGFGPADCAEVGERLYGRLVESGLLAHGT